MDVVRAPAGLAVLAMLGCGAKPAAVERSADVRASEAAPVEVAPSAQASGELLDEASARRILAGRFRAAGLRILEDVSLEVEGVTLVADGFDPARRVGYEYIAPEERDLELDAGERDRLAALPAIRIMVQQPASAADLERAAGAFLAEVPPQP